MYVKHYNDFMLDVTKNAYMFFYGESRHIGEHSSIHKHRLNNLFMPKIIMTPQSKFFTQSISVLELITLKLSQRFVNIVMFLI